MNRLGRDGPQLVAEISAFSAADALQWAGSSRMTGRLTFRSDGSQVTLRLERGGLVFASSNRPIEGFGRHLFAEGLVDEIDLAAAIVYSRDAQSRIGVAMVELEVLTEEAVRQALYDHNINLATLPVAWSEGWLSAEMLPTGGREDLDPEPADATMILMEAARRADELRTLERCLPSDETILATGKVALPDGASARWRRALETHEPGASIHSHYERVGGCRFNFLEALRNLVGHGALEFAGEERVGSETFRLAL